MRPISIYSFVHTVYTYTLTLTVDTKTYPVNVIIGVENCSNTLQNNFDGRGVHSLKKHLLETGFTTAGVM